ncbi:heterokaryon incompatibility protein-domain-containing protein [Sordaria brevicollis]|uniref:Heterokaryon incompatibility protein-domain-containing protein n=1 Tax=Sordaria brevicollis TaxID=83679 RepID=A0AAE0U2H8_SORBR|nr:heterokaryon incompatibility protein-domain-containing protein [Sordaria brevicollis]
MADVPPTSPYKSLDRTTQEIRLLTFDVPQETATEPDSAPPVISLSLSHVALLPPSSSSSTPGSLPVPSFQALSYVWGVPIDEPLPTILLNGISMTVTPNLHSALVFLLSQQHDDSFKTSFWIDALCINQADNDEKSFQVPLMSKIYTSASRVLVWLGLLPQPGDGPHGHKDCGCTLKTIAWLGGMFKEQVSKKRESDDPLLASNPEVAGLSPEDQRRRIAQGFVWTVLQYSITRDHGQENAKTGGFDFERIWQLFRQRPYWRRAWIVQEVVLAKKAMVLCGSDERVVVDWENVRDALQLFEWMILYANNDLRYKRLYELLGEIIPSVVHLEEATNAYRLSQRKGHDGMRLMEVLLFTDFADAEDMAIQATDPRDRIYGLLGLIRESDRMKIPVDYSDETTVGTVLTHVAKALIQEYGPDVLCYHRETNRWTREGLPTWVPDWTAPRSPTIGSVNLDGTEGKREFDATKGTRWPFNCPLRTEVVGQSKHALYLSGAVMSTVVCIGSEFTSIPGQDDYLAACRAWLEELQQLASKSDEKVKGNIWRVPMADFGLVSRTDMETPERYIRGFNVLLGKVEAPTEAQTTEETKQAWMMSESWDYRRAWKIYGRRAFLDVHGRPGLAPRLTSPDDAIALFTGGQVPVMLRENSDGVRRYAVLGTCYVHSLMDGEGMETTQWKEAISSDQQILLV